ncbi:golvesin C-terminal-like domain-containing protein [Roseimaritima ulvae]|uniref:Golvesin/Xly CBD-like domain-containing protein n=1 Tax=Roseimaritima ulvae TaxID=980254 RepID=A0A5B9QLV2_9BACT|nr:hypothetical protein [Roseimaritima ulvae]QEG38580.1 hypothetical protein UC8_05370 [Roseimaritima ulvae]
MHPAPHSRRGFSYLEVQVAAVLLAVGISGLAPLVVIQSRQATRVAERLTSSEPIYLAPVDGDWHRRLGALADVSASAAAPLTPHRRPQLISSRSGYPAFRTHAAAGGYQYWVTYYDPLAYGSQLVWHYTSGTYGSYAQWQFTDVPAGYYEVYTTHSARSYWHPAAPFRIYDDTAVVHSTQINQRLFPNDYSYDGQTWERLGTVRIVSGTLRVRLVDDTSSPGYLAANAIMIRPLEVVSVRSLTPASDTQASCTIRIRTP